MWGKGKKMFISINQLKRTLLSNEWYTGIGRYTNSVLLLFWIRMMFWSI